MQKGRVLKFQCLSCKTPISFSVFDLERLEDVLPCEGCSRKYLFNDETLKRQLRKFEMLCRQIADSEEILGSTVIGVDVGEHHVKIPYNILLRRLTSTLELFIDNSPLKIDFRLEPIHDLPKTHCEG